MVIQDDMDLPEFEDLESLEVPLTQAHLMAAAPYVGKVCESVNNEFMMCRQTLKDCRECVELGKEVTECAVDFFIRVKANCLDEHNQYANCIDKSSGNFKPWVCRKTHEAYKTCLDRCMDVQYPGFGYFARARIHKTQIIKLPEHCPCDPMGGEPKHVPEPKDFPRKDPRFGARLYWTTE